MKLLAILLMLSQSIGWPALIRQADKSMVRLETTNKVASGVLFTKDGLVVTVAHVFSTKPEESITGNGRPVRILKINRDRDLAVVRFAVAGEVPIALASVTPPKGTDVMMLGYGNGSIETIPTFGYISVAKNRLTGNIWVDGMILYGDSGGALIDGSGRLVGINCGIFHDGPWTHMADITRIEDVRAFIAEFLK